MAPGSGDFGIALPAFKSVEKRSDRANLPVMRLVLYALALALAADPGAAAGRNWGESLRVDATALHDSIAANHPGPVNPADPGFERRNDAQFALALKRAKSAHSFADYFYAMQAYAASFDDGHIGYGVFGATPDEIRAWPGFLTRYDGYGHQLVFVSKPWSGAPAGAILVGCDGLTADEVARRRVGSRFGRWGLASQRRIFGGLTFLDTGNPYVETPRRCRFTLAGRVLDVDLQWRQPDGNLYERYNVLGSPSHATVGLRTLADGTRWFTLPSFNGDPDSEAGKQLRALLDRLDTDAAAIRSAPAIVLDLRGNGGGSSDWSFQIARRLWGQGAIDRHPEPPMTVRWRASPGNLDAIRKSYRERSAGGHLSPETDEWYRETIAGLEQAIASHQPLWTIEPTPANDDPANADAALGAGSVHQLAGPVYVLTDAECMSACLDAVDLWTRLGAIPVGQETGADTLYMEVRQVRLPAGIGAVSIPMKVYSGRARGSNEPVIPVHRFQRRHFRYGRGRSLDCDASRAPSRGPELAARARSKAVENT